MRQVNDRVLCRVIHKDSGKVCFVPGTVLVLPCRPDNKFFTVRLYTGQRVSRTDVNPDSLHLEDDDDDDEEEEEEEEEDFSQPDA